MKTTKTRILLADDHALLRMGLKALIDVQRDMAVVGEAEDGEAAVAALPEVYAYVPIHRAGDVIRSTASVQQVFCYLHLLFDDEQELSALADRISGMLSVKDEDGKDLLFRLYRF